MRRREATQTDHLALAWHTATFMRVKRLKPLQSYLQRAKRVIAGERRQRPLSQEDRRTVLEARDRWKRMLNAASQRRTREVTDGG